MLAGSTSAAENGTYLETAEDLILHLPQYLEEVLKMDEESQSKGRGLLERSQCFADFMKIFNGLRKKNLWAVRGI